MTTTRKCNKWEQEVLQYDPFSGDFGGSDDRDFSDKISVARKPGPCHDCGQTIQPGETIRRKVALFDGNMMTWRWCRLCCDAMALSWADYGDAIDARFRLRDKVVL